MPIRFSLFTFALRVVTKLNIEAFLNQSAGHPVIDVRSPGEYRHAHIPGAISLPLFSDEERSAVGTAYKQQGREPAMMLGLDYYGPGMQRIISALKKNSDDRHLFIHCWRGGMRSGVVSYMLDLFGYKVTTLTGGYKNFRRTVLDSFSSPKNILLLGGKTGSAKTKVLQVLRQQGGQVIDLEALAHHKGSAYGGIGETQAPTQEMFENELYMELAKLDITKPVWLEDESQRIGSVNLPPALWNQMRQAPVRYLEIPFEQRLHYLAEEYGKFPPENLKAATLRIQKRLGGLETKKVLQLLDEANMKAAFSILLKYYDKVYDKATAERKPGSITVFDSPVTDPAINAVKVSAAPSAGITQH